MTLSREQRRVAVAVLAFLLTALVALAVTAGVVLHLRAWQTALLSFAVVLVVLPVYAAIRARDDMSREEEVRYRFHQLPPGATTRLTLLRLGSIFLLFLYVFLIASLVEGDGARTALLLLGAAVWLIVRTVGLVHLSRRYDDR